MPDSNSLYGSLTSSLGRSRSTPSTRSMTPNTGTRVTNVGGTPISRPMGSINTNTNLMNESSIMSNNNLQNRQMFGKFDSNMMQMSGKLDKMSSSIVGAINQQTAIISKIGSGIGSALSQLPNALNSAVSQSLESIGNTLSQLFSEKIEVLQERQREANRYVVESLQEYQQSFWSTLIKHERRVFDKMWGELPTLSNVKDEIMKSVIANSSWLQKFLGVGKKRDTGPKLAAFTKDYKDLISDMANKAIKFYQYQTNASEKMLENLDLIRNSHLTNVSELRNMMELFVKNNKDTKQAIEAIEAQEELLKAVSRATGRTRQIVATKSAQNTESEFLSQLVDRLQDIQIKDKRGKLVGFNGLEKFFTGSDYQLGQLESYLTKFVKEQPGRDASVTQLLSVLAKWRSRNNTGLTDQDIQNIISTSIAAPLDANALQQMYPALANQIPANALAGANQPNYAQELADWSQKYHKKWTKSIGRPYDKLTQFISDVGSSIKLQPETTEAEMIWKLIESYQEKNKGLEESKIKSLTKDDIIKVFPNADDSFVKQFNQILKKYKASDPKNASVFESIFGSMTDSKGSALKKTIDKFSLANNGLSDLSKTLTESRKDMQDLKKSIMDNTKSQDINTELLGAKGFGGIMKDFGLALLSPTTWVKTIFPLGMKLFRYWSMWRLGNMAVGWARKGINFTRDSVVGKFAYNSMWIPAKVHVINPLLEGIGSLLEKVIGTERMQYIKDTLGKLADITRNAWNGLFGATPEARSAARSKIISPILDALSNFWSDKVVPFLVKAFVMYTGARGAFNTAHAILTNPHPITKAKRMWKVFSGRVGQGFTEGMDGLKGIPHSLSRFKQTDTIKNFMIGYNSPTNAGFGKSFLSKIGAGLSSATALSGGSGGIFAGIKAVGGTAISSFLKPIFHTITGFGKLFIKAIPVLGPLALLIKGVSWLNSKAFGNDTDGKKSFKYYVNKMTGFVWQSFLGIGKTILGFFKPSNLWSVTKVFLGGLIGLVSGVAKGTLRLIGDVVVGAIKGGIGAITGVFDAIYEGLMWLWRKVTFQSAPEEKKLASIEQENYNKLIEGRNYLDQNASEIIKTVGGVNSKKVSDVLTSGTGIIVNDSEAAVLASLGGVLTAETMEYIKSVKTEEDKLKAREKILADIKFAKERRNEYGDMWDSATMELFKKSISHAESFYDNISKASLDVIKSTGEVLRDSSVTKMHEIWRTVYTEEEIEKAQEKYGKGIVNDPTALKKAVDDLRSEIRKNSDKLVKETSEMKDIVGAQLDLQKKKEQAEKEKEERNNKAIQASGSLAGLVDFLQTGEFSKWMSDVGHKLGSTMNKLVKFFQGQNWSGMIGSVTQSLGALTGGLIGGLFGRESATKFFVQAKKIADQHGLKLMSKFFDSGHKSVIGELEKISDDVASIKENGVGQKADENPNPNGGVINPPSSGNTGGNGNTGDSGLRAHIDFNTAAFKDRSTSDATKNEILTSAVDNLIGKVKYGAYATYYNGKRSLARYSEGAKFKWNEKEKKFDLGGTHNGFHTLDCSQFVAYMQSQLGNNDFVFGKSGVAMNARQIFKELNDKKISPRASLNDAQPGDIVFELVTKNSGSNARNRVAEGLPHHIGMVMLDSNGTLMMAHSTGDGDRFGVGGVQKEPLAAYIKRKSKKNAFVIYPSKVSIPLNPFKPTTPIGTGPASEYDTKFSEIMSSGLDSAKLTGAAGKVYGKYKDTFDEGFKQYSNLNPAVVFAQMMAESSGRENAHSDKNAKGLFQLTPIAVKELARHGLHFDVNDPKQNIQAGLAFHNLMLKAFKGNETDALVAYNMGEGATRKWIKEGRKLDSLPDETRGYIEKISKMAKNYSKAPVKELNKQPDATKLETEKNSNKETVTANKKLEDIVEKYKDTIHTEQGYLAFAKELYENNIDIGAVGMLKAGTGATRFQGYATARFEDIRDKLKKHTGNILKNSRPMVSTIAKYGIDNYITNNLQNVKGSTPAEKMYNHLYNSALKNGYNEKEARFMAISSMYEMDNVMNSNVFHLTNKDVMEAMNSDSKEVPTVLKSKDMSLNTSSFFSNSVWGSRIDPVKFGKSMLVELSKQPGVDQKKLEVVQGHLNSLTQNRSIWWGNDQELITKMMSGNWTPAEIKAKIEADEDYRRAAKEMSELAKAILDMLGNVDSNNKSVQVLNFMASQNFHKASTELRTATAGQKRGRSQRDEVKENRASISGRPQVGTP